MRVLQGKVNVLTVGFKEIVKKHPILGITEVEIMSNKITLEIDERTAEALVLSLDEFFKSEYFGFQEYSEEAVLICAKATKAHSQLVKHLGGDSNLAEYLEKQVPVKLRIERLEALEINEIR